MDKQKNKFPFFNKLFSKRKSPKPPQEDVSFQPETREVVYFDEEGVPRKGKSPLKIVKKIEYQTENPGETKSAWIPYERQVYNNLEEVSSPSYENIIDHYSEEIEPENTQTNWTPTWSNSDLEESSLKSDDSSDVASDVSKTTISYDSIYTDPIKSSQSDNDSFFDHIENNSSSFEDIDSSKLFKEVSIDDDESMESSSEDDDLGPMRPGIFRQNRIIKRDSGFVKSPNELYSDSGSDDSFF